MYGGERDIIPVVHIVRIRGEGNLIEIIGQACVLVQTAIIVHGIDKFLDIRALVDALVRIVRVRLSHSRIHDDFFHKLVHGHALAVDNPLFYVVSKIKELLFRAARKAHFVQINERVIDGKLVFKRVILQGFHRFCADSALGEIDNSNERLAVEGIVDKPQVRKQVLDFFPFEEFKAAEHFIGEHVRGELLFKRARERVEPHKYRKIGIAIAPAHEPCNRVRDIARLAAFFLRLVHLRVVAVGIFRPKRFVFSPSVVFNHGVGKL